jgi:hypothetical protein
MDVAVLLLFASFITAVVVATLSRHEMLRTSVRRPRLFLLAVVGAAAATVPVDLYAVVYGTVGPGGARLGEVADRLLLLNVAASCGVAALHGCLRGRALAGSATAATGAGAVAVCSPGSDTGSGGQAVRMGVLGWTGPLFALVVVTAVVALGSGGNGSGPSSVGTTAGGVGSALAIYSLLVCVISTSALFRGSRTGSAIDPQEG